MAGEHRFSGSKEQRESLRRAAHKDRERAARSGSARPGNHQHFSNQPAVANQPAEPVGTVIRGLRGRIKRLVFDRGFGFIVADQGGQEYFFHRSTVMIEGGFDGLRENDRVTFTAIPSHKGPRAQDVDDDVQAGPQEPQSGNTL